VRSADPSSPQQLARATRSSLPVHATGGPAGYGPAGMSDHVPASAATAAVVEVGAAVVEVGAAVVEVGAAVVEAACFPCPVPQPVMTNREAVTNNHPRRPSFKSFLLVAI
jgi:hypothetical protein